MKKKIDSVHHSDAPVTATDSSDKSGRPLSDYAFTGLTLIIFATNETDSLVRTVTTFVEGCKKEDLSEIVIVYPDFVTDECLTTAEGLRDTYAAVPVTLLRQEKRGFGAGAKQALAGVTSSHVMMTDADWSHDFSVVPGMIEIVKVNPEAICKFSRRMTRDSFHNYSKVRYLFNSLAQVFLKALYGNRCTDMTDAGQIAPSKILKSIRWKEDGYAFLIELVLRPMRLGCRYIEVPADCYGRAQGVSRNSALCKIGYLKQALIIRATPPKKIAPSLFIKEQT
ncbi:MAG: glycosyltransferase [Clostridia bacterium]|nr:glycosyltransferase [Clostridia bacterium]